MVLVRLCILDITQRLPDLVKSSSWHWPLPPEDRGYVLNAHKHSPGKHGTCEAVHEVWHMILGDRKLSFSWKGLLKKVTSCLLVVDVVLDQDESGNNLYVCIYIVFKVVL